LVIFSSANAFRRSVNLETIPILLEVRVDHKVIITFLIPKDDYVLRIAEQLENKSRNIRIRNIEPSLQTSITVVIVDRKYSWAAELKDDTAQNTIQAIGTATYSTSQPTVM